VGDDERLELPEVGLMDAGGDTDVRLSELDNEELDDEPFSSGGEEEKGLVGGEREKRGCPGSEVVTVAVLTVLGFRLSSGCSGSCGGGRIRALVI